MAQELLCTAPEAVFVDESGFLKVDYSKLDVEMVTLDEWLRRNSLGDAEDQLTTGLACLEPSTRT